jgi:zinc protease
MAYHSEIEKKIEALTPEQLAAAARRHFDPKKLVLVTAGDFDTKTAASN